MKRILFIIVGFLTTMVVLAQNHAEDNLASLPINDQEMTIAIIKARATFSKFLEAFADKNSGATNFSIKYPFKATGSYEHIWLDKIAIESGNIVGLISSEPKKTSSVKFNDKVVINPSNISDWMYFDGSKMVGCTSLEVLKKRQIEQQNASNSSRIDMNYFNYENDVDSKPKQVEDERFTFGFEEESVGLDDYDPENKLSLQEEDGSSNDVIQSLVGKKSSVAAGTKSPIFENYENHVGGTNSLTDFEGKFVYIDIWATWCAPCKKEIPFLQELEKDFEDSNIEFISISIDDPNGKKGSKEAWKNMVEKQNFSGVQLFANEGFKSRFISEYKVNSIPRFILIDPDGYVIDSNAKRPSDPMLKEQFLDLGI